MVTIADFEKLFKTFLRENKYPTGQIIKKQYYFPVDQLKVRV